MSRSPEWAARAETILAAERKVTAAAKAAARAERDALAAAERTGIIERPGPVGDLFTVESPPDGAHLAGTPRRR